MQGRPRCPTCGQERSGYLFFYAHEMSISWAEGEADELVLHTAVSFLVDLIRSVIPLAAAAQMAREERTAIP